MSLLISGAVFASRKCPDVTERDWTLDERSRPPELQELVRNHEESKYK